MQYKPTSIVVPSGITSGGIIISVFLGRRIIPRPPHPEYLTSPLLNCLLERIDNDVPSRTRYGERYPTIHTFHGLVILIAEGISLDGHFPGLMQTPWRNPIGRLTRFVDSTSFEPTCLIQFFGYFCFRGIPAWLWDLPLQLIVLKKLCVCVQNVDLSDKDASRGRLSDRADLS